MPELLNSNQPPKAPRKDLSMEMRLIIAFVLMGIVLFVAPLFFSPPKGPKRVPQQPTQTQAVEAPKQEPAPTPEAPKTKPPKSVPAPAVEIGADKEQTTTINTDHYVVTLSNRGAVVTSWVLKGFKDSTGHDLDLVNTKSITGPDAKVPPPFAIVYKDDKPADELNHALFKATPAPDGLGVEFEYGAGQLHAQKTFQFTRNGYRTAITSDATQNGTGVPHLLVWRGGFGDLSVLNRQTVEQSVYYDPAQGKLVTNRASAASNGPIRAGGAYSFAGLQDTFFAALFQAPDKGTIDIHTYKDDIAPSKNAAAAPYVGVGIGGDANNAFSVFVGPKSIDILKAENLPQLIDWGWFWFIAKPLFAVLHWLNDHLLHNYGWSIVVITIVINILLLPLRFQSMKSAKKMQALQPQIKAINAKYKDVGMRDPRKAEQNQEVMELYKKHGVNPMGGCLPMLIQLPILYAFYKVLNVTVELRGAPWLWVADLSQPEQLPIHVLPLVMIVSQFWMQKMTPNPGADASQAKMMRFMPLLFGFFFYNMSSGLVLYWLTGNLVGIVQQALMNRATPAPAPPAPPVQPAKKKSKG